jgi:hypothetical protein
MAFGEDDLVVQGGMRVQKILSEEPAEKQDSHEFDRGKGRGGVSGACLGRYARMLKRMRLAQLPKLLGFIHISSVAKRRAMNHQIPPF